MEIDMLLLLCYFFKVKIFFQQKKSIKGVLFYGPVFAVAKKMLFENYQKMSPPLKICV